MKKKILLFSSLLFSWAAFSQTAITINSADMPIPTADYNVDKITSANPPQPTLGNNQNWDYSNYVGNSPLTVSYMPETDPFFTSAGIDVYINWIKNLTPDVGYEVSDELDFNANKVEYKGLYVYKQGYSLETFTGNGNDSITFASQGLIYPSGRTAIPFPCTVGSAWNTTTSRVAVDFKLTLTAYGLNKTPGQQVFRHTEKDSVVGWGKLSVHTQSGASIPYDVLMVRQEVYTIDSMYLGGAPAPTALLAGFGITQGQKTGLYYAYNFFRKGSWMYLMRRFYDIDATYTTLSDSYVNADNLSTVGVEEAVEYSSLVFPNPTNGSELKVEVMGKNIPFSQYVVTDMLGRKVQEGNAGENAISKMEIRLNDNLPNGTYFVTVLGLDNQTVITEKFDLIR
jgi:hypothetical protein